jgi:quinol-cytochrome oxidoreductase complex cytochrome b subunit
MGLHRHPCPSGREYARNHARDSPLGSPRNGDHGLAFTGYLLPWDQLAIWAITVGSNMARATPFLGHEGPGFQLLNVGGYDLITQASDARFLLLGARTVGEETLNRFYIMHCVAIPIVVSLLIAIHFWRVRKDGGISQPL